MSRLGSDFGMLDNAETHVSVTKSFIRKMDLFRMLLNSTMPVALTAFVPDE